MEDKLSTELVDIIAKSCESENLYSLKFKEKKIEYFSPLEQKFHLLDRDLFLSLSKNKTFLESLKQEIQKCKVKISPVYKQIRQLQHSNNNVGECINVVEEFLDLKFRIEEIDVALKTKDYHKSCTHISKALQNPNSKNVEEITHYQQRLFVEIQEELEKNKSNIGEVIKCVKYFAMIGMRDQGIQIYTDYLKGALEKETKLQLELNVKNCRMFKNEDKQYTYCTLLTLVIDTLASCIERNKKFIVENYGRKRLHVLIEKTQRIFDHSIDVIFDPYLDSLKKLNDSVESRELDMVLEELSVSYERLVLFLGFMRREYSYSLDEKPSGGSPKRRKKEIKALDQKKAHGSLMEIMATYMNVDALFFKTSIGFIRKNATKEQIKVAASMPTSSSASQLQKAKLDQALFTERRRKSLPPTISDSEEDSDSEDSEDEDSDSSDSEETKTNRKESWESELVFDFFMIFKRSLERSRHTNEKQIICATINQILRIVSEDMKEIIFQPLEVIRNTQNNPMLGGKPMEHQQFKSVIIAFNDIKKTTEFLLKLKFSFERKFKISETDTANLHAKQMVIVRLQDFLVTSKRLEEELKKYLSLYVDQFIRPLLFEVPELRTKNFIVSESDYNNFGLESSWADRFVVSAGRVLSRYKRSFSPPNFDLLVKLIVQKVLLIVKEIIFKKKFNIFGGFLFDSEMRAIQKYFSSSVQGTLREQFMEMNQICSLLRLKSSNEYQYLMNEYFRLTKEEQKQILNLRVDYKK